MPFAVADHDGILTLTLDTPRSAVNILNQATARQLVELLGGITPRTTRAIVFETAKPGSFVNGVGLLLAHATQTVAGVTAAAALPWAAYRAVREAPVPTIAVVQGNCFGCGVELALQCDFRIASDTGETCFYMTEINDYRFLPLFGSTWNLPEAVGLADAVDLLLWGHRWDAPTAYAHGLVDAIAPHTELAALRTRFLTGIRDGTQPSRRRGRVVWGTAEDAVVESARQRIAALPPAVAPVYTAGLDLLSRGTRQTETHVEHQARELEASTISALSTAGKSAFAFFYLRQMASERAAGRLPREQEPITLCASGPPSPLMDRLRAQTIPGIQWMPHGPATFRFIGAAGATRAADDVEVCDALAAHPSPGVSIHAPTAAAGGPLIELAVHAATQLPHPSQLAALAYVLQRHGFAVARTTPAGTFGTSRLLLAYLAPLAHATCDATEAARVNATLRAFGFVRRPHALLATIDWPALVPALAENTGLNAADVHRRLTLLAHTTTWHAPEVPRLSDALCVSLLEAVVQARADGTVRDAPTIDLMARELLDFPLHLTSLCVWLKRTTVAAAIAAPAELAAFAPATAVAAAHTFVLEGRDFYR